MSEQTYFVTGSSGFIGRELVKTLCRQGHNLHLLVRTPGKIADLTGSGIKIFQGDVTDFQLVLEAMKGCTHVFHLAAHAKPYDRDPAIFDRVNVEGTRNVMEAALRNHVQKVVFTSTAGTFRITGDTDDATESDPKPEVYHTDYSRTKRLSEFICREYSGKGLHIVTVYPTRVFGPGIINESNSVTKILGLYIKGKWRIIPGNGKTYGNYVFIEDVVEGHLKAMEHGKHGSDYILGGENVTFDAFFSSMKEASGIDRRLIHIRFPFLWFAAVMMVFVAGLTNRAPMITPGWVRRYLQHRRLSSFKAMREIDYRYTPLTEAFKKTIDWLQLNK